MFSLLLALQVRDGFVDGFQARFLLGQLADVSAAESIFFFGSAEAFEVVAKAFLVVEDAAFFGLQLVDGSVDIDDFSFDSDDLIELFAGLIGDVFVAGVNQNLFGGDVGNSQGDRKSVV